MTVAGNLERSLHNNPPLDHPLHGLLLVDKPGYEEIYPEKVDSAEALSDSERPPRLLTSHDIVYRVRRWSGEKRIGHTGTLDPMASGVLVLTLGNATRLTEYHQGHDKRYIAEVSLGAATDTYDRTGTITETASIPELTAQQIDNALDQFRGDIMQLPPAYSAIKQDGKKAYQQARKGNELALAPRPVTFHKLELIDFRPPALIRINIHCSSGTYVRSLAYDLGIALGTVATLSFLRRVAVGEFTIEQAHNLEAIELASRAGKLSNLLLPAHFGMTIPIVQLDEQALHRLGFGQQVRMPNTHFKPAADATSPLPAKGMLAQALAPDGHLSGIIICMVASANDHAVWRADKWFVDSQSL